MFYRQDMQKLVSSCYYSQTVVLAFIIAFKETLQFVLSINTIQYNTNFIHSPVDGKGRETVQLVVTF